MTLVTRQATAGFGPELGSSVLNQLSASIYADGSSPPTSPSFSFFSKKIFSCFYINKKELLGCYSATHKYRVHCGTFVGPCLLVRPIYAMFQPNKSMFRSVSFIISLLGCLSCSIFNLISFVIKYCTDNVIQIFHDFFNVLWYL